jgi:hypothetical protein
MYLACICQYNEYMTNVHFGSRWLTHVGFPQEIIEHKALKCR